MPGFKGMIDAIRRTLCRPPVHGREKVPRTAIEALDVFGRCPNCGEALEGHKYWRLASTVIGGPENTERRLAALVEARMWMEASRIAEWRHDRDIREYGVVQCPDGPRLGLIVAVFTFDLYANDFREASQLLTEEDSQMLMRLAADSWLMFKGRDR